MDNLERTNYYDELEKEDNENPHLIRGTIGALLGALVGAIPWALAFSFGWFVSYLGFAIILLAFKGYKLFGGKVKKSTVFILAIVTIISIFVAQLTGEVASLFKYIADNGIEGYGFADIPYFVSAIFSDSESITSFFMNMGGGLIFAALGGSRMLSSIMTEANSNKNVEVTKEEEDCNIDLN